LDFTTTVLDKEGGSESLKESRIDAKVYTRALQLGGGIISPNHLDTEAQSQNMSDGLPGPKSPLKRLESLKEVIIKTNSEER
jgi:hypothetical protein